jgi:hypothetical protein
MAIRERVGQRMAEQEKGATTDYSGWRLLKTILALEVLAEDYEAARQTEKAVQIFRFC